MWNNFFSKLKSYIISLVLIIILGVLYSNFSQLFTDKFGFWLGEMVQIGSVFILIVLCGVIVHFYEKFKK